MTAPREAPLDTLLYALVQLSASLDSAAESLAAASAASSALFPLVGDACAAPPRPIMNPRLSAALYLLAAEVQTRFAGKACDRVTDIGLTCTTQGRAMPDLCDVCLVAWFVSLVALLPVPSTQEILGE